MTRPETAPIVVMDEETARHLIGDRRKRDTLTERAKPIAIPLGVFLTLVSMIVIAVVAFGGKADESKVDKLDERLRLVETALEVQTEILKRIERSVGAQP